MSDLPAPLTPAECDLRGMPYMPLDIVRLFDSDFYALSNGDEFKAGLSLWGKAFLQVPGGSLPDNDKLLAHLSGAGPNWLKVKEMALHGWIKCSDGRLYHATVAEKVAEAWQCRLDRRARTEAARAAKLATKHAANGTTPPPSVTTSVTEPVAISVTDNVTRLVAKSVTGSKGTEQNGTEERKKERIPKPSVSPSADAEVDRAFGDFWSRYPRKVGKAAARRAFGAAVRKAAADAIIGALDRAEWNPDPRFIPHPTTWLVDERWLDEPADFDPVLQAAGLKLSDYSGETLQ